MMWEGPNRARDSCGVLRRARLSPEAVRRFQERRLPTVIGQAVSGVPYYAALFKKAGLTALEIRSLTDLPGVPWTSKKDLRRAEAPDLLSKDASPRRLLTFKTTGSTGVPLVLKRTAAEDFLFHLFRMRAIRSYGLRCRQRFVRLRNGNLDHLPLSWRLARSLGLYRQDIVNTEKPPRSNAAELLALAPDVVCGYNSSLARIARIIHYDMGRSLPLRFAVGGADTLTPLLRRQIQDAFRAPVYDTYECQEVGLLAWECRETGLYHVCDDNAVIEVLKEGRPAGEGETGEVVVTSLHLRAMPFIRYRLEDIVTVGPGRCPCGLPFRTFRSIEAKKQDYFRLPDGREFYPWAASLVVVDEAPWVLQFQLLQEREDRVVMLTEAMEPPSPAELERLKACVLPLLGPDVVFEVKIVPAIEPTPGGKFWVRRSLVNSMYEDGSEG
jgi:phenylacetate-CoA ligase